MQIYKAIPGRALSFGLISRAFQRPRGPPIALTLTFIKQTNTKHMIYVLFTFERDSF